MKRTISSFLPAISAPVILSLLLVSMGCQKNDSTPPSTPSIMTVSFNGTAFQPTKVVGLDIGGTLTVAGLQIVAGDSIGVTIAFADNSRVDTVLSFLSAEVNYSDSKGTFKFESGNARSHGTVTLSGLDKVGLSVAGSFSGVLYDTGSDSVVISNGQFNSAFLAY